MWSIEKWRTYLWGSLSFCALTTKPLQHFLHPRAQGELACESLGGQPVCYVIPMRLHSTLGDTTTADYLSRLPLPEPSDPTDEPEMVANFFHLHALLVSEFSYASGSCLQLTQLREQITNCWPKNKKSMKQELEPYFHIRHELSVEGLLVMLGDHCLVPLSL